MSEDTVEFLHGKFDEVAELLKTRLEGWAGLLGSPVEVDRQGEVHSAIAVGVAKEQGLCITILFAGWRNRDQESDSVRVDLEYLVRCWGLPVILEGSEQWVPTDRASIEVAKALQGHRMQGQQVHGERCVVTDGDLVPDDDYLVYENTVTVEKVTL